MAEAPRYAPHDAAPHVHQASDTRTIWKVIAASSVGTMIEWYDFYIFGSLAAVIAGPARAKKELLEMAERYAADEVMVLTITGDYVNHDAEEAAVILPALKSLRAGLGVFGCLGCAATNTPPQ